MELNLEGQRDGGRSAGRLPAFLSGAVCGFPGNCIFLTVIYMGGCSSVWLISTPELVILGIIRKLASKLWRTSQLTDFPRGFCISYYPA